MIKWPKHCFFSCYKATCSFSEATSDSKMLKKDKKPKFDKKKRPKLFRNKKNRIRHQQPGASAASGPTRIRFRAKYQKNQHYDPENLKKPDSDLDPIHQLLAFRAHSFQALKPKK